MQKSGKIMKIGSYELELFPEKTRAGYDRCSEEKDDMALCLFRYLLSGAKKESLIFLESLGLDPEKIPLARPLAPPDEEGMVLFHCTAALCARLLHGGDTTPRQSEEEAGVSMVFVSREADFTPGRQRMFEKEVEIRFVMELPFDPAFFEGREA